MAQRDTVFLTGAGGFVGGHVLRALLSAGYPVRALLRPGSRAIAAAEGCDVVVGDLHRPGSLVAAMRGSRYLVHVAALYSFSPGRRAEMWDTNVRGCAGILEAAYLAGVQRAVVTSSSATVGPARGDRPATEEQFPTHTDLSPYHASKVQQERAATAAQIPAVLVLPTAPVGPNDWKPTPTGKMIVDFMRGRIFASLGGGINVVPVEDVARAHVLALEHGRPRERYLVGGENLSLSRLWQLLAEACGRRAPSMQIPYQIALALGWAEELGFRLRGNDARSTAAPLVPLEGVRMARYNMFVSDRKARAELGFESTAISAALERAVKWYCDHGYVL